MIPISVKNTNLKIFLAKILEWRLSLFLSLCLILGGTSQAVFGYKLTLYLISLAMLGLALSMPLKRPVNRLFTFPFLIFLAFFILHLLYLIPLYPNVWADLPGRQTIVNGFEVLGSSLPILPLSITPEKTLLTLLSFLPIFAVWVTVSLSASKKEIRNVFPTLLGVGAISVIIGFLQLATEGTSFYLYEISHFSSSVGFFSNSNHQAILLVMLLPFAIHYSLRTSRYEYREVFKRRAIGLSLIIVFLAGIMLTRSVAGYILVFISGLLSLLALKKTSSINIKPIFAITIALIVIVILDFIFLGQFVHELVGEVESDHGTSRRVLFRTTFEAAKIYFPYGSGPGSFKDIYQLHEQHDLLWRKFANHAHNDYLQIFLEFGALGIFILLSAFSTFLYFVVSAIRKKSDYTLTSSPLILISILAVILHSTVDYPLRTLAIAAFAAFLTASISRQKDL